MAKFSRTTLYEASQVLSSQLKYHGQLDDLMDKWELDEFAGSDGGAIRGRVREVFRYLKGNPDVKHEGRFISDLFVEEALRHGKTDALLRSIERDGFVFDEDGVLRRMLPEALDLPAADDEVHELLDEYRLDTTKSHLEQAIRSHSEGDWAAANGQFRTFLESLLDEVAYLLVPNAPRGQHQGEARREALAQLQQPFLSEALREWGNQGKNLVNGVFKYLHTQGAHPGLSDQEDSTFRLHLVLLLGRRFLRRLATFLQGRS